MSIFQTSASVRGFAFEKLVDLQRVDTLVNNAGVMALPKREVSADGFEMRFATNVLEPFVPTGLPLRSILTAPRAVTVYPSGLRT